MAVKRVRVFGFNTIVPVVITNSIILSSYKIQLTHGKTAVKRRERERGYNYRQSPDIVLAWYYKSVYFQGRHSNTLILKLYYNHRG